MNTNGFVIRIKTEDFYEDIVNDVEKWFDASNYEEDVKRPLPIGKNKKVIGLFKDESGGKIVIEFVRLRAKTWACLRMIKAKGAKKCVIKRELMFQNYKDCQSNDDKSY